MAGKQYVNAGDEVTKELPFSEVCMHMQVAGKIRDVKVSAGRSGMYAEIRNDDGVTWGSAVTMGEAGFYRDGLGEYYIA